MTPDESFMITNVTLSGLAIIPVLILSRSSLFHSYNHNFAVLSGVHWLKRANNLFLMSLVLTVAADAVYIVLVRSDEDFSSLIQASNFLSLASGFFEQLATIHSLVATLGIGLDLLYVKETGRGIDIAGGLNDKAYKTFRCARNEINDGNKKTIDGRIVHRAVTLLGLVLLFLAVAVLYEACDGYAVYYLVTINSSGKGVETGIDTLKYAVMVDRYITAVHTARKLGATFDFLVWTLALLLTGFTGSLVSQARMKTRYSLSTTFLLFAATLLCLVRFAWHLFYNTVWLLPTSSSGAPIWFDVVDPVLNAWLFTTNLVLLHLILTWPIRGL